MYIQHKVAEVSTKRKRTKLSFRTQHRKFSLSTQDYCLIRLEIEHDVRYDSATFKMLTT
jgi:hypothetical protein